MEKVIKHIERFLEEEYNKNIFCKNVSGSFGDHWQSREKEKANRNGCWGWYYDMPSPQLWTDGTLWSVTSVSA